MPRMHHLRRKLLLLICVCLTVSIAQWWVHVPNALSVSYIHRSNRQVFIANVSKDYSSWTPETNVNITERRFLSSENGRVFILGAVAKNSTPGAIWDKIVLYGQWYDQRYVNVTYLNCCFKVGDGTVTQSKPSDHMVSGYPAVFERSRLVDWYITCDRPNSGTEFGLSHAMRQSSLVSIARYSSCDNTTLAYIEPYYSTKEADGYTVITTKMAYNSTPPEIVVGFLEAMQYLGVHKVVTYVYKNLDPNIKTILRHYAHKGILDYTTIELADEARTPRNFRTATGQYRNDEWIVIRDALERNSGASYFGIFDMDEYLIPSNNRSIPSLLNDLRDTYPQASHFFFKNVHFLFENNTCASMTIPSQCSLYQRHTMTAPLRFNDIHEKMFLIPTQVVTKTVSNHNIESKVDFQRITCPETEAYVRHYGSCARKFKRSKVCRTQRTWVQDTSMVEWAERTVHNNVQNALKRLGY